MEAMDMGGMFLILGIGIILLGIYIFRRSASQVHSGTLGKHSGMDILRERYARGEIDSAEYQSRKKDLETIKIEGNLLIKKGSGITGKNCPLTLLYKSG